MLLQRNTYLHIAGVELGAFKPLLARNQIPYFTTLRDQEVDVDARGYLALEALMLAITEGIATTSGYSRSDVKFIVEGYPNVFINLAEAETIEDFNDLYVMVLRLGELRELHCGRRENLFRECSVTWADPVWSGFSERHDTAAMPWTSVNMFHAGNIVMGVKRRASELNIPLLLT